MGKRLFQVVAAVWFAVMIGNNLTRSPPSVSLDDLVFATIPVWLGAGLSMALRYVLFGGRAPRPR